MKHENILKLLAGTSKIARESGNIIKESSANFIEKSVIKGNYVSREEYEQLKRLVVKLQKEVDSLKK
jgi:hypothetical protein